MVRSWLLLRAVIDVFIIETSAHTLTFAFALLAIHPHIQDKVFDEAVKLWPDLNSDSVSYQSSNIDPSS
jgi:hypothetical protein